MAKSTKSLVSLAKGSTVKKATPAKKRTVAKKELTPEEERDLKAKNVVKELLSDTEVDLTLKGKEEKNDDLLEMEGQPPEENGGDVWLQEQVAVLTTENEKLKEDYQKIYAENQRLKLGEGIEGDDELKKGITTVFHEIQSQYMKNPGFTPYGTPNFVIVPPAFLNRLIVFFPFLAKEKRF